MFQLLLWSTGASFTGGNQIKWRSVSKCLSSWWLMTQKLIRLLLGSSHSKIFMETEKNQRHSMIRFFTLIMRWLLFIKANWVLRIQEVTVKERRMWRLHSKRQSLWWKFSPTLKPRISTLCLPEKSLSSRDSKWKRCFTQIITMWTSFTILKSSLTPSLECLIQLWRSEQTWCLWKKSPWSKRRSRTTMMRICSIRSTNIWNLNLSSGLRRKLCSRDRSSRLLLDLCIICSHQQLKSQENRWGCQILVKMMHKLCRGDLNNKIQLRLIRLYSISFKNSSSRLKGRWIRKILISLCWVASAAANLSF